MHPALVAVAKATEGTPFDRQLWLVGGAVRDSLLGGAEDHDFDIVLEGDALAVARKLWEKGVSEIPPVTYPRFGTALVRVGGANVEFVTARRESYDPDSRKPEVEPATLLEDAMRRDFTVNTLIQNLHTGELRDPLGRGVADLESKVLRTPLDPEKTFFDDPLRMLRAVRFRWKLGFQPAPGLYDAIRREAERLKVVSAERIRDEFVKILLHATASSALRDLMELELIDQFAPELREMEGIDQGRWHHLDVWEHTLLVIDNLPYPRTLTQVLAALLHDIAKPRTWSCDADLNIRFFGHETLGAEMAEEILRRLKFSNEDAFPVALLVRNHMRLGSFEKLTTPAARRLMRDMGPQLDDLLILVEADAASLRPGVRVMDLNPIREKLRETRFQTPVGALNSPLSGNEIMDLTGIPAGPEIGRLKEALVEEVIEGRILPGDRDAARAWIQLQSPRAKYTQDQ